MEVVVATKKPMTEEYDLVLKAVSGCQRAYTSLMDRYREAIYRQVQKMIDNEEDALDLTLEAFGKAFRNLDSYQPDYAFSTWLFRIAINSCIDHLRKKRLPVQSIDEPTIEDGDQVLSDRLSSDRLNPEELIIRKQRLELVRELLDCLNDKYRLMIEMRYFEEMSYEEISRDLQIPIGTVKAQLHRAREALYEQLSRPGASAYMEKRHRRTELKRRHLLDELKENSALA